MPNLQGNVYLNIKCAPPILLNTLRNLFWRYLYSQCIKSSKGPVNAFLYLSAIDFLLNKNHVDSTSDTNYICNSLNLNIHFCHCDSLLKFIHFLMHLVLRAYYKFKCANAVIVFQITLSFLYRTFVYGRFLDRRLLQGTETSPRARPIIVMAGHILCNINITVTWSQLPAGVLF